MENAHHFVVHVPYKGERGAHVDWRVTPAHKDIEGALRECRRAQEEGRQAFITGRDEANEILFVLSVADYPVAGVTSLSKAIFDGPDERTFDAVNTFAEKMDWTI